MSYVYHNLIFKPIYNLLIGLFAISPIVNAGLAVILVTIVVRLILFPLSQKAVRAQVQMQSISAELEKIKTKYKDDKEEQAKKTLELYKEKGVNPFSGFLVLIIQLPVVWALYRTFLSTGFPHVDTTLLYSFVHAPAAISDMFFGLDLTQKSILLALLAATATFFQMRLAAGRMNTKSVKKSEGSSFGDDLTKSMQTQMQFVLPVIVFLIAYKISGVIALYWLTTNLFTIGQEIVVRRKLAAKAL